MPCYPSLPRYAEGRDSRSSVEEKDYLPLLPYLYRVQKWVQKKSGLIPMLDIGSTHKDDLGRLFSDLKAEIPA